jgi:hypothetical protein
MNKYPVVQLKPTQLFNVLFTLGEQNKKCPKNHAIMIIRSKIKKEDLA